MIHTKNSPYSKALIAILTILDCVLMFASFRGAYWLEFKVFPLAAGYFHALLAICLLSWVVASFFTNAYEADKLKSLTRITKVSLKTLVPHGILVAAYIALVDSVVVPVNFVIMVHALFLLSSIFSKFILLSLYSLVRNSDKNRSKTVIIGYTNAGRELYNYFRKDRSSGIEFLGFFDDKHDNQHITGTLDKVKDFCIEHEVSELYYALPSDDGLIKELTDFADDNFIHFGLVQDLSGLSYDRLYTYNYGDEIPVISYSKTENRGTSGKLYDEFALKIKNLPFSS